MRSKLREISKNAKKVWIKVTIDMLAVATEINWRAKYDALDKFWYTHSIDKDIKLNYIEIFKVIRTFNCVLFGQNYLRHICVICNIIKWFSLHVLWRIFSAYRNYLWVVGLYGVIIFKFMHTLYLHLKNKSILLYIKLNKNEHCDCNLML